MQKTRKRRARASSSRLNRDHQHSVGQGMNPTHYCHAMAKRLCIIAATLNISEPTNKRFTIFSKGVSSFGMDTCIIPVVTPLKNVATVDVFWRLRLLRSCADWTASAPNSTKSLSARPSVAICGPIVRQRSCRYLCVVSSA